MLMFLGPQRVFSLVVSFLLRFLPHGVLRLPFGKPSLQEFEKSLLNLLCVSVAPVYFYMVGFLTLRKPLNPWASGFMFGFSSPLVTIFSYLKGPEARLLPQSLSYVSITWATNGEV